MAQGSTWQPLVGPSASFATLSRALLCPFPLTPALCPGPPVISPAPLLYLGTKLRAFPVYPGRGHTKGCTKSWDVGKQEHSENMLTLDG